MELPQPGWYFHQPDGSTRWWDGQSWTPYVLPPQPLPVPAGPFPQPLTPPPAPPASTGYTARPVTPTAAPRPPRPDTSRTSFLQSRWFIISSGVLLLAVGVLLFSGVIF